MKRKGFTLVEIVISLVILVAIGLVVGIGLNKVFDKNVDTDYETLVNKVISSADAYLSNNQTLLNELNSERGYIVINLAELIDEKLLEGGLVNPNTGKELGEEAGEEFIRATLDSHGVLKLSYPTETITEAYLEAQNKLVEHNTSFACDLIASYAPEWGTSTLRLVNPDGKINTTATIYDVIKDVSCNANFAEPGSYKIVYTYVLPGSEVTKELTRTLVVTPAMTDMVNLTATIKPAKVIINEPVTITVSATNRVGETRVLNASEYKISAAATNVAGNFTSTITYNKENSDKTVPTTTVKYTVVDNISELINDDPKCTKQGDNSCWYIGDNSGNYLRYANKVWRIYKKNADNSLGIILDQPTGATYAFTNYVNNYNCRPTSCCNSSQSPAGHRSEYLLTQNPNGLNTYLNSTFLNTLTNHASTVKTTTFDITGYNKSNTSQITQKVGLMSYADYSKIARCSTFTCNSSYLKNSTNWGLGTYYQTDLSISTSYNLATGGFSRYVYPKYNTSLFVNTAGSVSGAGGSYSLVIVTSGRTATSSSGTMLGVKPVIELNSNIKISGGNGTASSPYVVR